MRSFAFLKLLLPSSITIFIDKYYLKPKGHKPIENSLKQEAGQINCNEEQFNICNALCIQYQIIILGRFSRQMPLQDFQILKKIGSGRFASVYKVKRLIDHQIYAMKRINLVTISQKQKKNALTEIKILSSIQHDNVISYKEVFYDQLINSICIILEYADGGDLGGLIQKCQYEGKRMQEEEIWEIIQQISKGLNFLHSHNILHRDLKTNNILLFKDGRIKIGDLNVAKISEGLCSTQTGTLSYASPQIWKGEMYDFKSDVWSFGCIIYEMMRLRKPFQSEDIQGLYKRIIKGNYPKITQNYSTQLKNLIIYLLQINPKLRPSSYHLMKMCLAHKFGAHQIDEKEPHPIFKRRRDKAKIPQKQLNLQNLPDSNYEDDFVLKRTCTDVDESNPYLSHSGLASSQSVNLLQVHHSQVSTPNNKKFKRNLVVRQKIDTKLKEMKELILLRHQPEQQKELEKLPITQSKNIRKRTFSIHNRKQPIKKNSQMSRSILQ